MRSHRSISRARHRRWVFFHYGVLILCKAAVSSLHGQEFEVVGSFDTPGDAVRIARFGSIVYVADSGTELLVIDVSDPAAPMPLPPIPSVETSVAHVVIDQNRMYFGRGRDVLEVYSLDDPKSPTFVAQALLPINQYWQVFVRSELAIFRRGGIQAHVIDISDLSAPTQLSELTSRNIGSFNSIGVNGSFLYVFETIAEFFSRVATWDISDPANPTGVGAIATRGLGFEICTMQGGAVLGEFAYAVGSPISPAGTVLQVVKGLETGAPVAGNPISFPVASANFALSQGTLIAAVREAGVQAYDNTDPLNPTLLTTFDTPGTARDLETSGDLIFVADGEAGLLILRLRPPNAASQWSRYR